MTTHPLIDPRVLKGGDDDLVDRPLAILGIDPGLKGAIACWNADASWVLDIPIELGVTPTAYDLAEMRAIVVAQARATRLVAFLETTNPWAGEARAATWAQATGIAIWRGMLAALEVPCETVHARSWTRRMDVEVKRKEGETDGAHKRRRKLRHLELARELYPALAPRLTRLKDNGRADALLLAAYGRSLEGEDRC